MKHQVHIFCDFDGTISMHDMIGQIMMEFIPVAAKPIINRIQAQELRIKEGVEALFALIPSVLYSDVVAFARQATEIRPGFEPFVQFATKQGWRFSVVSGGFDFFVQPAISPVHNLVDVFCNHIDSSGELLRVVWDHPCKVRGSSGSGYKNGGSDGSECDKDECDRGSCGGGYRNGGCCDGGCGLCKPTIIETVCNNDDYRIVIGDGVTDLKAARIADRVFARGNLTSILKAENIAFDSFETFFDIMEMLQNTIPAEGGICE